MNTINYKDSLLLIIDIQEKLSNMLNDESVKQNAIKIAKAAKILNIPAIITEQYPKGLGSTVSEIRESLPDALYIEKTYFSVLKESGFVQKISDYGKKQIIICGIETHICVLQTAFELINLGYEVFVVSSASGSRNMENKETALQRLRHASCQTVTTEMVLFEWLEGSKNPAFKELQALIK